MAEMKKSPTSKHSVTRTLFFLRQPNNAAVTTDAVVTTPTKVNSKKKCCWNEAILQSIHHENWKKLLKLLTFLGKERATRCSSGKDLPECTSLCLRKDSCFWSKSGGNALHLALQKPHVPFRSIEALCRFDPNLVSEVDCIRKRTPLHIAANLCKSHDVVFYLWNLNYRAASTLDLHNCTPLHLACQRTFTPTNSDYQKYVSSSLHDEESKVTEAVIHGLCIASPWSVNREDNEGITPIEYAISSGVNYQGLKFMWEISRQQWGRVKERALFQTKNALLCSARQQVERDGQENMSGKETNVSSSPLFGTRHLKLGTGVVTQSRLNKKNAPQA